MLTQCQQVMGQFEQRVIIAHYGFPNNWLRELIQQPGGGGHFRVDLRNQDGSQPTPLERFIHEIILPHCDNQNLLMQIRDETVRVRFLSHQNRWILPSDVAWVLGELADRFHLLFELKANNFQVLKGLAVNEIDVDYSSGF